MNNEKKGEDEKRKLKEVNIKYQFIEINLIREKLKGVIRVIRRNKGSVLKSKGYDRYK